MEEGGKGGEDSWNGVSVRGGENKDDNVFFGEPPTANEKRTRVSLEGSYVMLRYVTLRYVLRYVK